MQTIKDVLAICSFILAITSYFAFDEARHQKLLNEELKQAQTNERTGSCSIKQGNETHTFLDCKITPEMAYVNNGY